mgnify:FL=1
MITQILINKKFSKNQTNQLEKLGFDIRQYDDSPHEEDYFVDLL